MSRSRLAVVGAMLAIGGFARADINIDYYAGPGFLSSFTVAAGANISLNPPSNATDVWIYADTTATEDIGRITFVTSKETAALRVHVTDDINGTAGFVFPATAGGDDWAGMNARLTDRVIILRGLINGDLTDSIKNIHEVLALSIGNDIDAAVEAEVCNKLHCVDTTTQSSFTFSVIEELQVQAGLTGGRLLGDVSTKTIDGNPGVLAVQGDSGGIGTATDFVDIDVTDGIILNLVSRGDMYANITVLDGSGEGRIRSLGTSGGDYLFDGKIEFLGFVTSAGAELDINGDMKGQIWIGGGVSQSGERLMVNGDLEGQIIINQNNVGGTWGSAFDIRIGPTAVLAPVPYYANTASSLGGGSVGEAPFGLHKESCSPGYSRADDNFPRRTVEQLINDDEVHLRFYGLVTCDGGERHVDSS